MARGSKTGMAASREDSLRAYSDRFFDEERKAFIGNEKTLPMQRGRKPS
jgi:hypothetical protein